MKRNSLMGELIGEVFGTFILILLGDGVVANFVTAPRLPADGYDWNTITLGWAFAVFAILTGRYLARKVHYLFCMAMAAIECMFMPFGTVLGVFTIIVLAKPSVKKMFK